MSTLTRDQSMVASGCLPACPIEGQCPQSLEISQWMPLAVSLHAPLRASVHITRDQSMVASGCLLRASVHNHSQSVNGCLGCLPACPIEEWALLMHMFEVWSRRWIVEPYQPMVELCGLCILVMMSDASCLYVKMAHQRPWPHVQ